MKRILIGCILYAVAASTLPGAAAATNEPAFLAAGEARAAIVDESREKYFSRLQPMEMAAKTGELLTAKGLAGQRAETRRRYRRGVREFNETEKSVIRWYTAAYQAKLERAYPDLARTPWRFVKVSDKIEGGLPHTRGRNIILSQGVVNWLVGMMEHETEAKAVFSASGILVHELVHVHQRRQPKRYADLYRKDWGFVKAAEIATTDWMRSHQVINPDGADATWVYPIRDGGAVRWILPLVVFSDGGGLKRMPKDFRLIAVTLRGKSGRFRVVEGGDGGDSMKPLTAEAAYARRFKDVDSLYHPNEIVADMVSTLFALDALLPKEQLSASLQQAAAQMFLADRRTVQRFYRKRPVIGSRPNRKP